MALSILPALLSLLASLAPARTTGNDLVVRVVDKDGKPVEGVQVGLCPHWSGHSSTFGIGVSDRDGSACIKAGFDTVRTDTQHSFFVRLGAPFDPDVRAEIDREHLDEFHPTLVVPEHGRVILALPAVADEQCHARLRVVPRAPEERGAIWSGSSLPQIPCKDHRAACEFVGLGLEIEYEVLGSSLPQPLHGTFRGPTKAGELVRVEVPGFEAPPKIRARLIDEDSHPVARVRLQWELSTHSESPGHQFFSSNGGEVVTDDAGIVLIPLSAEQARQPSRTLSVAAVLDATKGQPIENAALTLPVADEFRAGELDLGQQMLAHFGSPAKFKDLDDKALERRFLELLDSPESETIDEGRGTDELLCEMVRRGGSDLESFVTDCAERLQPVGDRAPSARRSDELTLRMALARIRKEPDPLQIVVEPTSRLEVPFPHSPRIACALRNSQSGSWRLDLPEHGGPFDCGFEVRDARGRLVPPNRRDSMPGGLYTGTTLAPGKSMPLRVNFNDKISLPHAGEYRVHVHYSWHEDLCELTSMQGRIVASSPEFVVRVTPCVITLTQARLGELRGAVHKLDPKKTLPLVNWHWRTTLTFEGEPVDPEDVLFRAGRDALPALFEALEDPKLEPELRAWVFAMLWNIVGGNDPSQPQWLGVIGPSSWSDAWPTSSEASTSFGHSERRGFGKIDPAKQAEFTKLWLETKANYELKIVS